MNTKQILVNGFCVAAVALSVSAQAAESAASYPSRPIRMLVPNAPGSSVDTLSRIFANKMTDVMGQQVVIDNRAGAGGIIGMEIAKAANPDGYTPDQRDHGGVHRGSAAAEKSDL